MAESNGSLLPGLWRDSLHVTRGLTACTPGSAPGPTLGNEYGKNFSFLLSCGCQVYIHKSLKHDNVVALLTHHLIDRSIALVLELCDNGSLRQLLTKTSGGLLTEPVTRRYFLQV